MSFINGMFVNPGTERGVLDSAVPAAPTSLAGLGYDAAINDELLELAIAAGPDAVNVAGLQVSATGRVFITDLGAIAANPAGYWGGIPLDIDGRLLVTTTELSAYWVRGWPISGTGAVCVTIA